jgi:hypothetical protein
LLNGIAAPGKDAPAALWLDPGPSLKGLGKNPAYQTHHAEFGNVPIGKMPRPPTVVRN